MNKLYKKSELIFSIVFIIIYIIGASFADEFSNMIGISKILTLPFFLVLSFILILFITKNNLFKKYGLCKPNYKAKHFLFYIPLLILISTNLWLGVKMNFNILESLLNVLAMLCVGFIEEIIFRGLLFKALEKDNIKSAIIISSVTFGIGHLINLFSSRLENIIPNICQVFYAMAVGFLFVIIFYKGGSLISCILTHSLVNALSIFQNTDFYTNLNEILISIVIIIVAISYSLILMKTLTTENKINKEQNTLTNDI